MSVLKFSLKMLLFCCSMLMFNNGVFQSSRECLANHWGSSSFFLSSFLHCGLSLILQRGFFSQKERKRSGMGNIIGCHSHFVDYIIQGVQKHISAETCFWCENQPLDQKPKSNNHISTCSNTSMCSILKCC